MNVLVLGTGGREHALAWKIAQSPQNPKVFLHPGNAGTRRDGFANLPGASDGGLTTLVEQAKREEVGLVVVGPEAMLADGYADEFRAQGIPVVGPNKEAAQLESSKIYSKEFMVRAEIPTAAYTTVENQDQLKSYLEEKNAYPIVLKLDGLAAGKGVVIAKSLDEAMAFGKEIWEDGRFGSKEQRLLVEENVVGRELSYIGFCDGNKFVPLATATDYKRLNDGGEGPNTGGMGCISPSPYLTPQVEAKIQEQVVDRFLAQVQKENLNYRGILFVGLMIDVQENPHVLEFNVRFGDPETQTTLLRMESDLLETLFHTAQGTLTECPAPQWTEKNSIYVVGAAPGYPVKPVTGSPIEGLDNLSGSTQVFFAGIGGNPDQLLTGGGRVLGLGLLGSSIEDCRTRVYAEMQKIAWENIHFRKDIGQ